jgi:hypothetical protein
MARRERVLDQEAGELADFAAGLRALRHRTGSPPYRKLAEVANFSASTLSEAASGRRLPTLEVTLAYVSACGGDPAEWRERWHKASAGHRPSARLRLTGLLRSASGRPIPGRLVAGAFGVALVAGALAFAMSGPSPAPPVIGATASTSSWVRDGADPKQSGCADQATTLASATVTGTGQLAYGVVELRYSAACGAGWTRYTPAAGSPDPTTVTITIDRPAPTANASATFVVHNGAIFSDLELFRGRCLVARASVAAGGRVTASAETPCTREAGLLPSAREG